MNSLGFSSSEHQEVWELLPWQVNGRLGEPDALKVAAHLQVCADCREELAAQRRVCAAMAAPASTVELMPSTSLAKLRERISKQAGEAPVSGPRDKRASRSLRPRAWPRRAAPVMIRVASLGAVLTLILVALLRLPPHPGDAAQRFRTVTTDAAPAATAVIRAVFAPTATVAQLQAVLDEAHLKIVAGPSAAGVYSLAMTRAEPVESSLKRLRAQPSVRFAEPLAAVPDAAPSR